MTADVPYEPYFTGITHYRDPKGRFEFQYPSDWIRSNLDENREGLNVRPRSEDGETFFAIWVSELSASVVANDLPDLRQGFEDGLKSLTGVVITTRNDNTYENVIRLERFLTHANGVQRVWVIYADVLQFVVTWQGATSEEYDYWLSMANYCFATFELPESLWYATDTDVQDSHPSSLDE